MTGTLTAFLVTLVGVWAALANIAPDVFQVKSEHPLMQYLWGPKTVWIAVILAALFIGAFVLDLDRRVEVARILRRAIDLLPRWRRQSALTGVALFYDGSDPNCYQPGGSVERIVVGGTVLSNETIYRLGIRSPTRLERCRVILVGSEPAPHDPGMHRIGLAMRPRIPTTRGSEEFAVNPNASAYVDILQELSPQSNPMHEAAVIRLVFVNEDRGRANWFEHNDYILAFRLEGPMLTPVTFRLAVEFDGRRKHRCWRVKPAA